MLGLTPSSRWWSDCFVTFPMLGLTMRCYKNTLEIIRDQPSDNWRTQSLGRVQKPIVNCGWWLWLPFLKSFRFVTAGPAGLWSIRFLTIIYWHCTTFLNSSDEYPLRNMLMLKISGNWGIFRLKYWHVLMNISLWDEAVDHLNNIISFIIFSAKWSN